MTLAEANIIEAAKRRQAALSLYYQNPNHCLACHAVIPCIKRPADARHQKFCCSSCSAKFNNPQRRTEPTTCTMCSNHVKKNAKIYCSHQCQQKALYTQYINRWLIGQEHGQVGIDTGNISSHIRHYLFEKHGPKCWKCGWSQIHPVTGKIPLTVNHIDGDSTYNAETNLELICPNCHSLTPTYGALNRGKGRKARKR